MRDSSLYTYVHARQPRPRDREPLVALALEGSPLVDADAVGANAALRALVVVDAGRAVAGNVVADGERLECL